MTETTSVNPQITDAVTQSNIKVLGEAPSMAIGSLYQSAAQALGIAAQHAVSGQQQIAISLQAAANEGAMKIFSLASVDAPQEVAATLADAKAGLANLARVNQQVEDAIKLDLKNVLGSAGDVNYAMRSVMDGFAASLKRLSAEQYRNALGLIKVAAIASTLAAMINKPENAASYQQLLETIERL